MDDTMSQEMAFGGENNEIHEDVFKFDPVEATDTQSEPSTDDKQDDVGSEEEPGRVPYSKFKKMKDELGERDSIISRMEERLAQLEDSRTDSSMSDDVEVPQSWVKLYGDSDVSKQAYQVQLQREAELEERATRRALSMFKEEASQEVAQLEQNEETIESNLSDLQESIGKKLTARQEEELLSIVDEFSPTGPDGKYVSMLPFDKAYDILELRSSKAQSKTINARSHVASLTNNNTEGDTDSSDSNFKRGWDSWREAL
jgi:hypothetical protein